MLLSAVLSGVAGRNVWELPDGFSPELAPLATGPIALTLLQFSTAAVPLVVATLGSWVAGATWAVDVPRQMTLTSQGSTAQFSAGQWVRLSYVEATTGLWTEMGFQIDYVLGYDV